MDRIFINTIVEAYYIDNDLNTKNFWNNKNECIIELNNELQAIFSNLYLEDNETYYEAKSYSKVIQQEIIYNLLDQYLNERYYKIEINADKIIEEGYAEIGTVVGTLGTLSAILTTLFYKQLSRGAYKVLTALDKTVINIAKFISNRLIGYKVKHSILIANLNVCQKKCGIHSVKDLRATTGMGIGGGIVIKSPLMPLTQEAYKQAECLKKCYLEYVLDQTVILAEAYLECLRDSGEYPKMLSDVSILLTHPTGEYCIEYYNYIRQFDADFKDALNVIFSDDLRSKQDMLNEYNSRLEEVFKKHMYKLRS